MDNQNNFYEKLTYVSEFTSKKIPFEEGNRNNHLFLFGCNCNKYGIPKFEALNYAIHNYTFGAIETTSTILNAYKNEKEHGTFTFPASIN